MLNAPIETTAAMAAIFSPGARLKAMGAFEAALANALAEAGIVPPGAAKTIADVCARGAFGDEVFAAIGAAGNPAIPFVRALTEQVREWDAAAAGFVHFGATSQDAIDSATMLQARDGLDLIEHDLAGFREALAALARRHARTPMIGRTLLQQAVPITFGFKVAGWLAGLDRTAARLASLRSHALAVQLGGPVGTLAGLGERGPEIARLLAEALGLPCPELAWHTSRERIAAIGAELGILTGQLGKIAGDVILSMQTEIGELREAAAVGKGGSSAMPHKRNPVTSLFAAAAARHTPHLAGALLACLPQEHERATGAWHAEWSLLPQLFGHAHAALLALHETFNGIEVDEAAMARNIAATQGLIFAEALAGAIAPGIGRGDAHRLVEELCRRAVAERRPLAELADEALPKEVPGPEPEGIHAAFDLARHVEPAARWVERLLVQRASGLKRS
jgi:3-carboxy-cis,cis-muconate cycloisomerase